MTIEEYKDRNKELARQGLQQKAEDGELPGCAPVGYLHLKQGRHQEIVIDEKLGPLIQQAFMKAAEGKSLRTIIRELTSLGLRSRNSKPMGVSSLAIVLKNLFYMGMIQYDGKFVFGKHEPLVDKELFFRVQRQLERKRRNGLTTAVYHHNLK